MALIIYKYLTRRTSVVVGTNFGGQASAVGLLQRLLCCGGAPAEYPYEVVIMPVGPNAVSDAGEIVEALNALMAYSKGAAADPRQRV